MKNWSRLGMLAAIFGLLWLSTAKADPISTEVHEHFCGTGGQIISKTSSTEITGWRYTCDTAYADAAPNVFDLPQDLGDV